MDLDAVRTFVAVADAGQFSHAAAELSITQQAVSKRVAALERELGIPLFTRTARGAQLTIDGQAFLPHARDLLHAEQRAAASVRPDRRALRIDVINRRLAPADLLRGFHQARPDVELAVMTLYDVESAITAIRSGAIDASFRAVRRSALPAELTATRVYDEPVELLTGPAHKLATARVVAPDRLAGQRIWMPGNVAGTEWSAYYDDLATTFGLTIDTIGPHFGTEPLLDTIADAATLATFVGARTRLVWPADHDLRRIALHDPIPVYPHALLWRADNPHPGLAALRDHLTTRTPSDADTWTPGWAI